MVKPDYFHDSIDPDDNARWQCKLIFAVSISPLMRFIKRLLKMKDKMVNTGTQLFIQIVFAVKGRYNLIKENHRDEPEK